MIADDDKPVSKILGVDDLINDGYLAEVNRTFFHPRGLALTVFWDEDDIAFLAVQDNRDDPEGWVYEEGEALEDVSNKVRRLREISLARYDARMEACGFWAQPIIDDGES